jgi:hypothetical protein
MRIIKLAFLLIFIICCRQNKEVKKTEQLRTEQQSEVLLEKVPNLYPKFSECEVDSFDWDIVFNKSKEYRSVSGKYFDKNLIPANFLDFSTRFISDSIFQKSHINFENLIAVVGACENTYVLHEMCWKFDDWDFITEIGIDENMENTFYFSDDVFYCEFLLIEVGIIRRLGFEKNNGEWYLTLYDINDC